jgi:hypothetical protein
VATSLIFLVVLGQATAAGDRGCIRLDKAARGIHIIHGQFSRGIPRVTYCLYALAGQQVLINIKPSGNLNTEGYLRFAGDPPRPDWGPGSPGGIVFNEALPWAGKYWLVVGQRFNERKVGGFEIEISAD